MATALRFAESGTTDFIMSAPRANWVSVGSSLPPMKKAGTLIFTSAQAAECCRAARAHRSGTS